MSTIYIMEAANLFCGDHDPTASMHLTLADLKLTPLQEMYQDHHAGGSRVHIEVALGIQKLEPTFKLNGWDPDLLTQFGLGSARSKVFTAYGVVRDKRTGAALEAKAILEGRLGKIEPDAFQRGELQGHDTNARNVRLLLPPCDSQSPRTMTPPSLSFDWRSTRWRSSIYARTGRRQCCASWQKVSPTRALLGASSRSPMHFQA